MIDKDEEQEQEQEQADEAATKKRPTSAFLAPIGDGTGGGGGAVVVAPEDVVGDAEEEGEPIVLSQTIEALDLEGI
jgi:hypothetical protein